MKKRILSIILAATLLLSVFTILPITASAEEADVADVAAEEDVAETGGSAMEIKKDLQNAGIGLTYYYYGNRNQCPYLRFIVTGGSGNYRYNWYYCGDTPIESGTKFATTTAPEQQVNWEGYYYCVVQDTVTSKQLRTRTAQVGGGSGVGVTQKLDPRLMGDKLVWHESQKEYTANMGDNAPEDFIRARYTLIANRTDTSHGNQSTMKRCLKLERDKFTGALTARSSDNSNWVNGYNEASGYNFSFDEETRTYSIDIQPLVAADWQYDDITYSFALYCSFYDNRKTYVDDESTSGSEIVGSYPASALYNGEIVTPYNGEHLYEAQIMDQDYSVGSVLTPNLNGGRWGGKESYVDVVWQYKKADGTWSDIGTGLTYTVKNSDLSRVLRCTVKPNYKGRMDGSFDRELYWPEDYFPSNEIVVPVDDTINISVYEPKLDTTADPTVTFNDTCKGVYFGLDTSTLAGTGMDWRRTENGSQSIWNNRKFTGGAQYDAVVYFKIKSGYAMDASHLTVYFNGKKTTNVTVDRNSIVATYSWTLSKPLETAGCTITKPAVGGTPDYNPVSLEPDKYTISKVSWYNISESRAMTTGEKFVKDKQYRISVDFAPVGNVLFDSSTVFLINGEKMYGYGQPGQMRQTYDFGYTGPVEQVNSVNIHIDVPTAGAHPDFTPLNDDPDKVRVTVAYWYLSEEPYPHLSSSDTFEAGKTYTVRLEIEGNQGYSVDTSYTTVSLNGTVMSTGTYSYGNNFIGKQKSFTVTAGGTLSGYCSSYLSESESTTVELLQNGVKKYNTTCTGNFVTYTVSNVQNGNYTLRVSKKNHVTRDYEITVSGNTQQNVEVCPIGDISGDGKVTTKDYAMANAHAQKVSLLSDDYQIKCGDVLKGDGKITTADAARINAAAQKIDPLW